MKRMHIVSVCFLGLLGADLSSGADCAAFPQDSTSQMECERIQKRLTEPQGNPVQVIGEIRSHGSQGGGSRGAGRLAGAQAPTFREPGAEPLLTIVLASGSTIRADTTWVEGDRLFFFSRGVKGSVRLVHVNRVENLSDKLRPGQRK